MIKEFAFSIANRHHFQDAEKAKDWMGLEADTYMSLYNYNDYVIEYYGVNKIKSSFINCYFRRIKYTI